MKQFLLYVKKAMVAGETYNLYALEGAVSTDGGSVPGTREFLIFASLEDPPDWVRQREPKVNVLPDEQSLLTLFPLDLLLGRSRHASRALDDLARKLREAKTNVLCFHPGCRQGARYKAVASVGLEGGCWLACSEEHLSPVTTMGFPLTDKDYVDLREVLPRYSMAES